MLRVSVVILSFCFNFLAFSQNTELRLLDSTETSRIEKMLSKADSFYKVNLDSSIYYINRAVLNLQPFDAPELKAKTLLYKSRYLLYKKEYGSIINVLNPNVENAENISLETMGRSYLNIGHAYKQEWIPDSALVYYIKALKAFEQTKSKRDISLTYLSLGLIYAKIGDKKLSKSFYDKSIMFSTNTEIMKLHKDQLIDQKKPISEDDAIGFSLDIIKIAESRNDIRLMVVTYSDVKKEYLRLKQYDKALEIAQKELQLRKQSKFDSTIPNTLVFIGSIYTLQNQPKKAIDSYLQALPEATDSLKLSIYNGLKDSYLQTNNPKKAIEFMDRYLQLKDSINERNVKASIAEITSKYQDEQQKQEIQTLSFQNEANVEKIANQRLTLLGTIVGSLLLLLLAFFGYKNYKAKQELNYTQLNFKLLQTQLNPHFMFNALNEIKLNLNVNNAEKSSVYITDYSKLMRSILEGSNQDFVTLKEDIDLIKNYLNLQQLVNNNSFTFSIHVEEELQTNFIKIPPMLTQPYVENAILHGVNDIENGHIEVNYKINAEKLLIEVSDNGQGFRDKPDSSGKHLHKSMGTSIIQQRIKNYGKLYDFKIEVITLSNETDGTTIAIRCPLKLKIV